MERVVYLLGAGFSAPLGLPVMTNFYMKSQDMYLAEPVKYAHFKEVFDTIREMSIIKNYYDANLFNIEDILSVLEMGEYLEGKKLKDVFLTYIKDVIAFYTPNMDEFADGRIPGNWADWLFGPYHTWKPFGMFVGNLLNLSFRTLPTFRGRHKDIVCEVQTNPAASYSIVTLNYDLIPETICSYVNRYFIKKDGYINDRQAEDPIQFNEGHGELAKLHGSIDTGVIVPPTWSKGVNTGIVPAWKSAYQVLADATQLRIIGYSLATADAYVKYLLKSAIIKEPRLKQIDVICRDSDGSVRARYDDFIKFDYFRFLAVDVDKYLKFHVDRYQSVGPGGVLALDKLEMAHADFMSLSHRQ